MGRREDKLEESQSSRVERPNSTVQSSTSCLKDPLTIYDIRKEVKTRRGLRHVRYSSVNKRVKSLEESGYVRKIGLKKTKAGFEASIYELTARAYLAILLNSINLDELVVRVDKATASAILADIMRAST